MRVNELAKEIGKTSKELLAILSEKGMEAKSNLSNLTQEQLEYIKSTFDIKNQDKSINENDKSEEEADKSKDIVHKKKLTAVFRPQNAQQPKNNKKPDNKQKSNRVINVIKADKEETDPENKKESIQTETAKEEVVKMEIPAKAATEKTVTDKENVKEAIKSKEESGTAQAEKSSDTKSVKKAEETSDKNEADDKKDIQNKVKSDMAVKENTDKVQVKNRESGNETLKKPEELKKEQDKNKQNTINVEMVAKMQGNSGDNHMNSRPRNNEAANRTNSQRDNRSGNSDRFSDRNQNRNFDRNRDNRNSDNRNFDNRNRDNRNSDNRGFDRNRNFDRNSSSFNRGDKNQSGNFSRNEGNDRGFNRNRDNSDSRGSFNRGDKNQSGNFNRGGGNFRQNSQGASSYQGRNSGFSGGFAKDKDEQAQRPQRNMARKDAAKPAEMDASLAKRNNSRINKNNFKNQKDDKKHRIEDGPAKGGKVSRHPFIKPVKQKVDVVEEDIKEIVIPERLTIKDFAAKLKLQPSAIVKKLFLKGQIVTLNTELSFEEAEEIALEYEVICTLEEKVDVIAELLKEDEEKEEEMVKRPPVVCVMGHVDHGKTSLLDAIRKANVTSHEAGGITQHIGAYMVKVGNEPITFLDTPGHEAFTAMRMRGAQSTDIAILVVAADDGVKPQTIEAINHAKAAGVEIIVAINKIDKPTANIDKVKQELSEYELIPEDWGGSTIFCPVSAKSKEGIGNLLEMVILAAEVRELKANPDRRARGLVIEAELDKGKGPVATILVQKGTLRVGDFVAAGACSGKVRAMMNDKGQRVKEATPSTPVEILGLDNVPNAGEVLVATENDKEAKAFAATFISEGKNKLIEETKAKLSLDDLFSQIKAGNVKELPLIVKADVQGSVEAVKQSLTKLSNEEVQVKIIHGAVGAINESDVALAVASNAIIIGFNVKPEVAAKATADREKVDLRLYKVIYKAIEDIESAMNGMLEPVYEEKVIGHAEIRQLFKASGIGTIAGSYVLDGKFIRGCKVRITREGTQIFDGNLASLKRFKDDVKEVKEGYECGLVFEKFNDIMELDMVEAYDMVEVPRK